MSMPEALSLLSSTGLVRPTRYLVRFSGPVDLIPAAANVRLSVTCEEAIVPGRSYATSEVREYGPQRRVPYVSLYTNDIPITFRVGTDFYERRVFEQWMDFINDPITHDMEYYNNYAFNLDLVQLGSGKDDSLTEQQNEGVLDGFLGNLISPIATGVQESFGLNRNARNNELIRIGQEKAIYTCRLREVYPVGIQEVPIGHAQNDQYMRVIVNFAFKDWISLPEATNNSVSTANQNSLRSAEQTFNTFQRSSSGSGGVIDVATRASQVYGLTQRGGSILPF